MKNVLGQSFKEEKPVYIENSVFAILTFYLGSNTDSLAQAGHS